MKKKPRILLLDLSQIHGKYLHKYWKKNLDISGLIYHKSKEKIFINIVKYLYLIHEKVLQKYSRLELHAASAA